MTILEQQAIEKYCVGLGVNVGCHKSSIRNSIGIDNDKDASAAVIKADASVLPFFSNSLDYVVSRHCLEHVRDAPLFVLHEWLRVLKPQGKLILVLPDGGNGDEEKCLRYASMSGEIINGGHGHTFTLPGIVALVKWAGANIIMAESQDSRPESTVRIMTIVGEKDPKRFTERASKHSTIFMKYRSGQVIPPETRWTMWVRRFFRCARSLITL